CRGARARRRRRARAPARAPDDQVDGAPVGAGAGGMKVHVGCGPHALLQGWANTDLRAFKGVAHVMDATEPWPWTGVTHVFGEHFIEHLEIDKAIDFLVHAGTSLGPGGRIRLSTPSLAWVIRPHFALGD